MKYCEEYAALLDAWFDGECTPEEADRVRAHLAGCPGCRAYLSELALLRDAFPDGEDAEVPEGFADGVMAAIRADAAPRKRRRPWKSLLPMAACLAVIVLAVNRLPIGMGGGSSGSTMAAAPAMAAPSAAADVAEASTEARSSETYQHFTSMSDGADASQNGVAESAPQAEQKAAGKQFSTVEDAAPAESPAAAPEAPATGVASMTAGAEEVWLAELTITAQQAEGLTEDWTVLDSGAEGDRYTLTRAQLEDLLARLGDDAPAYTPGQGELALVTVVP